MGTKLHILHLTHNMGVGGTQQVISQLVSNLDGEVYKSSVACIDGDVGLLGESLIKQGIVFHVFSRPPGFDTDLIKEIRATLKNSEVDIIHCHQYTPFVYGVLAALYTGVKVVFTEHGRFHPDGYSWKRRVANPVLSWATDSIVAISGATAQALAHYEWFPRRSIKVIYNGMLPVVANTRSDYRSELGLQPDDLVFGTIARFDSIKNIPMMIESFRAVRKVDASARLVLVGDGDERAALEALVAMRGLSGDVIFTGYQKDTAQYMALMDVYLLTSFSEGTSMTLLEAQSMGVCSIVTRVGGNTEIVQHQVNGVVVESGDVESLADWMIRLGADSALREALGQAGKKVFAERFQIGKMISQYSDVYSRLVA